jgi:hypothetical protein
MKEEIKKNEKASQEKIKELENILSEQKNILQIQEQNILENNKIIENYDNKKNEMKNENEQLLLIILNNNKKYEKYENQIIEINQELEMARNHNNNFLLAVSGTHNSTIKLNNIEYEKQLKELKEDCISQLQSHSLSHVIEFTVISETHKQIITDLKSKHETIITTINNNKNKEITHLKNIALEEKEYLQSLHNDEILSINTQNTLILTQIQTKHEEEINKLTTRHLKEITLLRSEKDKADRQTSREMKKTLDLTDSINELKDNIMKQKNKENKNNGNNNGNSNGNNGDNNGNNDNNDNNYSSILHNNSNNSHNNGMISLEEKDTAKIINKLKSKLDAISIEYAHSEGRCFQLLATRIKEKEEIIEMKREMKKEMKEEMKKEMKEEMKKEMKEEMKREMEKEMENDMNNMRINGTGKESNQVSLIEGLRQECDLLRRTVRGSNVLPEQQDKLGKNRSNDLSYTDNGLLALLDKSRDELGGGMGVSRPVGKTSSSFLIY